MKPSTSRLEQTAAAVGLILSLLFVGYEIRQNTQVARATAVQETTSQIISWGTEAAMNDDWIRIITNLGNGGTYAELSPEDQTRYNWIVSHTVRIMENRYRQAEMGVINFKDLGISGGTSNPNWFRSKHLLDWWQSTDRTRSWAPDFLVFFETEVLAIRSPEPE